MKFFNLQLKAFFLLTITFASSYTLACTCLYGGKFQEYSASHPVIVRATILSYGERLRINDSYFETLSVAITDVIKGSLEHREINLQGDTGMSCFKYIRSIDYPVGSEHLFALSTSGALQPLWGCGESSVRIEGSRVRGFDGNGGGSYTMDLEELIELVD